MISAQKVGTEYLSWPSWQKWCTDMYRQILASYNSQRWTGDYIPTGDDEGESPAIDVMLFESPEGYFASEYDWQIIDRLALSPVILFFRTQIFYQLKPKHIFMASTYLTLCLYSLTFSFKVGHMKESHAGNRCNSE